MRPTRRSGSPACAAPPASRVSSTGQRRIASWTATPASLLKRLDERMDFWEERGRERLAAKPDRPAVEFDNILNQDEAFLDLVANPRVLPYIDEMVSCPRLKSTWLALKWKGGSARDT